MLQRLLTQRRSQARRTTAGRSLVILVIRLRLDRIRQQLRSASGLVSTAVTLSLKALMSLQP
jgi:hypothetical protein